MNAKRRHQDRPQAQPRRVQRRVDRARPLARSSASANSTIRIAFFADSPIVVEQADLEVDVVVEAAQGRREHGADDAERHDEQHRDRHATSSRTAPRGRGTRRAARSRTAPAPAHPTGAPGYDSAGPLETEPRRQLRDQPFHLVHRLRRCCTPGAPWPWMFERRPAVEAFESRRPLFQRHVANDENGAIVRRCGAHVPAAQILRRHAERRIALHVHALDPAAIDEVVDVGAAPRGGRASC